MKTYAYRAINAIGEQQNGRLDALNLVDLETRLKHFGLDLISAKSSPKHQNNFFFAHTRYQQVYWFFKHLQILMKENILLSDALIILKDLAPTSHLKETITNLLEGIYGGQSLAMAFQRSSNIFDSVIMTMLQENKQNKALSLILDRMVAYAHLLNKITQYRKYLVFYYFVLSTFLVLMAISVFLHLPFEAAAGLPSFTMVGLVIIPLALLFILLFLYIIPRQIPRRLIEWWGFHWSIQREIWAYQFLSTFGILYCQEVEATRAITVIQKTIPNPYMKAVLRRIKEELLSGTKLEEAMEHSYLFNVSILRLMRNGRQNGHLKDTLLMSDHIWGVALEEKFSRMKQYTVILSILLMTFMAFFMIRFLHFYF